MVAAYYLFVTWKYPGIWFQGSTNPLFLPLLNVVCTLQHRAFSTEENSLLLYFGAFWDIVLKFVMVLVISSKFSYPQLLPEIKLKSHGVFWKETVGLLLWRPLLYLCSWTQGPLSFMREGPEKMGKDKKRVKKWKDSTTSEWCLPSKWPRTQWRR